MDRNKLAIQALKDIKIHPKQKKETRFEFGIMIALEALENKTAYDINKIVERLIRKSDCIKVLYKSNIEHGNYSAAALLGQQIQTISECIDIVKGGGIDG